MHNKNTKNMHQKSTIKTRLMNTEMNKQEGTELIKRQDMEGTPFTIVKTEGKCFLTMGKYQISEQMEEEDIALYLMENEWNIIVTIAGIIAEHVVKANSK